MRLSVRTSLIGLFLTCFSTSVFAVQLDWGGQFWFENHWLNNQQLDRGLPAYDNDPDLTSRGGAYVPGTGERNIVWYSAFMKLKPKATVNDSLNLKSELHIGSPIYGFFGRGYPSSPDERYNFTGSNRDGMAITAQRFWATLVTDFGTIEVGRAPIHWGLGAIWNSGDNLFERYQSTGDMVRLTSKFGNFWLMPSYSKVAVGNSVGGAQDASGVTVQGSDDVTDINVGGKYDNSEEDFELGFMWTHRVGNVAQRSVMFTPRNTGSNRISYNIYDLYAKKRLIRWTFGGEVPLFSGNLGAIDGAKEFTYKAFAFIGEVSYSSDLWDIFLKAGHVPGQPNGSPGTAQTPSAAATEAGDTIFRAVYLNKDYKLGLIMFNYNIYGLQNNNPDTTNSASLNSPYGTGIVNANYAALSPNIKLDKWTLKVTGVVGYANTTAQKNKTFFNHNNRRYYNGPVDNSVPDQGNFLGKEFDFGVSYKWDENFILAWDTGVWFPGDYYAFTNHPFIKNLDPSMMFASWLRAGISF